MYKVLFIILFVFSSLRVEASQNHKVGQQSFKISDPQTSRLIDAFVWYPTKFGTPKPLGRKSPFKPVLAVSAAPLLGKPQTFPLVLLSHGSGGTADKLFWIVQALVKNGFVVLAVNHPGNMTGDNSGRGLVEVWRRPRDLSFALDQLLKKKDFKNRIDLKRIGAVGHSAGGTTALLLTGAKFSRKSFESPVPNCKGTKDPYFAIWCKQIDDLDLNEYKRDVIEADYSDPRVKVSVAYDPGFARSFSKSSMIRIRSRTYVFLAEKLFTPFDQIYAKDFINLLGQEATEVVPSAVHMTFIQACKVGFPKKDPELRELCAHNAQKIQIQKRVATDTMKFLKRYL